MKINIDLRLFFRTRGCLLVLALGSFHCSGDTEDPCQDVVCNQPPAATCDGAQTRVSYTGGKCVDGTCTYSEQREACTCLSGVCQVPLDCGNNAIDGTEVCDGTALGGRTCVDEGFASGPLACRADCGGFDTGSCVPIPGCGNNTINGTEVCDGTDLNGRTCIDEGFLGGNLGCLASCAGYDTTNCLNCGNNTVDGTEVCDGTALNGRTCIDEGFTGGPLGCLANCTGYDTNNCIDDCGNNTIDGTEVCDGTALNGRTCIDEGFTGGPLGCLANCTAFDTSNCVGGCGNNTIDGTEVCDGTALNGRTCVDEGFTGGTIGCLANCTAFDTTGCVDFPDCGNNSINGQEACDGTDLDGRTCVDEGFESGNLFCMMDCSDFNRQNCNNGCGNGRYEVSVGEDCDGAQIPGDCYNIGGFLKGGTLGCNADCTFDTSGCLPDTACQGVTCDDLVTCTGPTSRHIINNGRCHAGQCQFEERDEECLIGEVCSSTTAQCEEQVIQGDVFVSLGGGRFTTCGIRDTGEAVCWGGDQHGRAQTATGTFTFAETGIRHGCGLRTDGTIACWGGNKAQVSEPPAGVFDSLTVGAEHNCALDAAGAPTCWGSNNNGAIDIPSGPWSQIDQGYSGGCGILAADSTLACWGNTGGPGWPPTTDTFTQVSVGRGAACAINTSGTVECSGVADPAGVFTSVSAGYGNACGLKPDGTVDCWGNNQAGAATAPGGLFTLVVMGFNHHACGIRTNGAVLCWGGNSSGHTITPNGGFTELYSRTNFSCGMRADGTVDCWGANSDPAAKTPRGWGPFSDLSVGSEHVCAVVAATGQALCWGRDVEGQSSPPPGELFSAIAAGVNHTCAVRASDGTAVCWGNNADGQSTPTSDAFTDLFAYGAGPNQHRTCGIKLDGTLACWGSTVNGLSTPPTGTFVSGASSPIHSCAVQTGGMVSCWGASSTGVTDVPAETFTMVTVASDQNSSTWSAGLRPDQTVAFWGAYTNPFESPPYRWISMSHGVNAAVLGDGTASIDTVQRVH